MLLTATNAMKRLTYTAVWALLGTAWCLHLDAQTLQCEGDISESWSDPVSVVREGGWGLWLREGQDEVSCQAQAEVLMAPVDDGGVFGRHELGPLRFRSIAEGTGPFKATVTVNLSRRDAPGYPLRLLDTWTQSAMFRVGLPDFVFDAGDRLAPVGLNSYDLVVDVTMTLERVRGRCYMLTTVTGGYGAGTYFGDVAVYGSPTGVSNETLEGFSQMRQWASGMAQSETMQQRMAASGASEEQIRQVQEMYAQMSGESIQAELPSDVTLTLQDVKFDDETNYRRSELSAMLKMAGHFVLSAQIDESAGFLDMLDATGPVTMGISQMGGALPGLGLANTETAKGKCPGSSGNQITFEPCPGHDSIDFENGPFCGKIEGAVMCNEQMEKLTVTADFLAGTELTECIR